MIRRVLIAVVVSLVVATSASAQASSDEGAITAWLQSFDRAFVAKALDKLASFYYSDVTIFVGGGVDNGWADYRDYHIGPELKGFENLQFEDRNIAVHVLDDGRVAYVTSEGALKARANDRDIDSAGLETLVLVKVGKAWNIRHSHTSARGRLSGDAGHPDAQG